MIFKICSSFLNHINHAVHETLVMGPLNNVDYTIHKYGYEEGTATNIDSKQVAVLTLQVGFVRMS
jgi:hypothetical protein